MLGGKQGAAPMQGSQRLDYDAIAELYDVHPYRAKTTDPQLTAFLGERDNLGELALLDIACGTGNQLITNHSKLPAARLVGIDHSLGMLRLARHKAPAIGWVRADAALVPLAGSSFDYISCQFAFHHFPDKSGMLGEAFRLLRPGGRLVLHNLCPEGCPDWLYYRYFPETWEIDQRDFWPADKIRCEMDAVGFAPVTVEHEHVRRDLNLAEWIERVRERASCSQLLTISDAAYAAGIERVERDIADPEMPRLAANHRCLATIRGGKP
jgi:ubiquinone/menaquinone biosynthesis C-methylase UbiE